MPCETVNIWAPPMPTCFIASRSAVKPSFVTLPSIQCHQVWGFAEAGGLRKPSTRGSLAGVDKTARKARAKSMVSVRLYHARLAGRTRYPLIRGGVRYRLSRRRTTGAHVDSGGPAH